MSYRIDYADRRAAGCGDDDDLFMMGDYGMGAVHSAANFGMGLAHSAAALGAHYGINAGLGLADWGASMPYEMSMDPMDSEGCANTHAVCENAAISPPCFGRDPEPAPVGQCGCGGPLPCGCGLLPLVPKMPLKRIFSIFMAVLMIVVLAFLIAIVVLIVQNCGGKKKKKSRCGC